MNTYKYN